MCLHFIHFLVIWCYYCVRLSLGNSLLRLMVENGSYYNLIHNSNYLPSTKCNRVWYWMEEYAWHHQSSVQPMILFTTKHMQQPLTIWNLGSGIRNQLTGLVLKNQTAVVADEAFLLPIFPPITHLLVALSLVCSNTKLRQQIDLWI